MRDTKRLNVGWGRAWGLGVPLVCVILLALVIVMNSRNRSRPADPVPTERITLLSGAGLRLPVEEITAAFKRRTGIMVDIRYGASNLLLGQLELTGEGDIFLPGDAFYTDLAARRGLVSDSVTIARFVPVIQVAAGNPKGIDAVPDLLREDIRLAVADTRAAAIGRLTPAIFEAYGMSMDDVDRRTVFTAVTSPELGQAIMLGHADAAINWRPVVMQFAATQAIAIPDEFNVLSPITIALTTASKWPGPAREFMAFMQGSLARDIFRRHEYDVD